MTEIISSIQRAIQTAKSTNELIDLLNEIIRLKRAQNDQVTTLTGTTSTTAPPPPEN